MINLVCSCLELYHRSSHSCLGLLFLAYTASLAATEGAERALIGDFASKEERATAFALCHMVVGLAALPAQYSLGLCGSFSAQPWPFP